MRTQASLGLAGLGLSLIVLLSAVPAARADRDSDSHGWLGIYTQALTSELREGLDYRGDGVLVNRVVPGSPADKAGIEKGDVIVSVNMRSVDSPDKLADIVGSHRGGDEVSLRVVRGGERRTFDVTLAAREYAEGQRGEDTPSVKDKDLDKKIEGGVDKDLDKEIEKSLKDLDKDKSGGDVPEPPEAPPTPDRREIRRMIRDGQGDVRAFGLPGRGRLGVRVQDLDEDLRGYFETDKGALVTNVVEDSPADRAGLKKGDVITQVGGTSVQNSSDLIEAMRGKEGRVSVEFYRHGARHSVQVLLDTPGPRGNGGPRIYSWRGDDDRRPDLGGPGADDLRRQIDDLREQIQQLRRDIEELKRER